MNIIIEGCAPYDGTYPLDMGRLTNRDIHTIKVVAGYTPLEYEAAGVRGDNDFVVAIAVIAVRKSGRFQTVSEDTFWDAEAGRIQVEVDEEDEAEDGPPLSAPETLGKPSGAPGPNGGELPPVRSLPHTGTDFSGT